VTDRYFGDVLGSYANGVQLDLRVKLAVDFLKSPWAQSHPTHAHPGDLATAALDLSTALFEVAAERGLMAALPDTDELSSPMRRHIRRQVRAQIVGQVATQEIAGEEAPKIATPPMVRQ
jgi:hypothetical protein